MNLNSIFTAIAYKNLVQVDIPGGSHQHELNNSNSLKDFFSKNQILEGEIIWSYFQDDQEPLRDNGKYHFYDARAKSFKRTGRSEWRLYYTGDFLQVAAIGDFLILGKTKDNEVYGLIFQRDSNWKRAAQTIFNIGDVSDKFEYLSDEDLSKKDLDYYRQKILVELGFENELPDDSKISNMAEEIYAKLRLEGKAFPSTNEMAKLAWDFSKIDISSADLALITWLDIEERFFRSLEKIVVQKRIDKGFDSVDDFIKYSLSVHNRRKSRMGFALQNHLAHLFTKRKVKYQAQKITEGKNQPDFIFPGINEYLSDDFDTSCLFMLAAKSSCKERWRQILTEANRIKTKHLCTLDTTISADQTKEMKDKYVVLVIPDQFKQSYSEYQKKQILSIDDFIQMVKSRQ